MTSETSYNKTISYKALIFENIRQRGWLFAVSTILFLLVQTVHATMRIDNHFASAGKDAVETYLLSFPSLLNGEDNFLLPFLFLVLAIVCGITGFSYLHQPKGVDFFHSFPLKREQWFTISYIGGLLIFLIPYSISSIFTLLIGAVKGVLTPVNFTASIFAILSGILCFLLIYQTTLFAVMLTGKTVVGVLATLVLIVYGTMVTELSYGLLSVFFKTGYTPFRRAMSSMGGFYELRDIASYLTPFGLFNLLLHGNSIQFEGDSIVFHASKSLGIFATTIVFILVLWLITRYLYKKRSLEAAGNALAYPKMASVLKIMIVIPTSLFIGLYSDSFFYNAANKWIFITSILASMILCGIIEFIYTQDLSQIFKRKIASLLSIASVIMILSFLHFDVFGFDSWFPKKDALESMALYSDSYSEYFEYPTPKDTELQSYQERITYYSLYHEDAQVVDFSPIYDLAQEGVENTKNGITSDKLHLDEYKDYTGIVIRFNKHSQSSKYRYYVVEQKSLLNCLESLCKQEAYRKELFPAFHLSADDLHDMDYSDFITTTDLSLTKEDQEKLLHAYQTDLLETPISTLQETEPVGAFTFALKEAQSENEFDEYFVSTLSNLYVYNSFRHTLAELERLHVTPCRKLSADDVVQLVHITYDDPFDEAIPDASGDLIVDETQSAETRNLITDPVEKQKLLDRVSYCPFGIAGTKRYASDSLEVLRNDEFSVTHLNLLPEK